MSQAYRKEAGWTTGPQQFWNFNGKTKRVKNLGPGFHFLLPAAVVLSRRVTAAVWCDTPNRFPLGWIIHYSQVTVVPLQL